MTPCFDISILSSAYFPPVEYFFAVANSGRVLIEQHENYQKQSWRSRCRILSATGPEDLSIPVVKDGRRCRPVRDIRIDYGEPWLRHHVGALAAAYNTSAFYEYYADELIPVLEKKPVFLFDLNMALFEKLMTLTGLQTPVFLTETYVRDYSLKLAQLDCRSRIQPKYKGKSLLAEHAREQAYYQVFVNSDPFAAQGGSKNAFIPNLSIIDLLSAEGPNAGNFLRI